MRTSGASNELVEVLKKRIFKSVDENERAKILGKIRTEISNTDVFGHAPHFEEELRKNYPFHPEYVDVLRTIIERTGLQRTRDMLRITRIVVRELVMKYSETGFAPLDDNALPPQPQEREDTGGNVLWQERDVHGLRHDR
ncbi:DUF499 domain-containing protein [Thermococcus peptonophilus]|uniref:DUF499 domain-containing protein n=1 Tax=Thermococcus peptonophilus TaxID=53952 RepID=UPI000AD9D473